MNRAALASLLALSISTVSVAAILERSPPGWSKYLTWMLSSV